MIDPRDEELLNREIDGENTAQQSSALRERLARGPELRERYDSLRELARTLERIKGVEPPPGLTDDILRSIRRRRPAVPRRGRWLEALGSVFGRRPAIRYAWTFAGGLALGIVVATLVDRSALFSRVDGTQLSGTILPDSGLGHLETVDRDQFAQDGVRGEVTTRLGDDVVLAEIRIDAPRAVEVVLEFDGDVLSPRGFERSGPSGGDVVIGSDHVRLRHAGQGRYVVVLGVTRRVRSQVRLKLSGDGVALERTLETRPEGS